MPIKGEDLAGPGGSEYHSRVRDPASGHRPRRRENRDREQKLLHGLFYVAHDCLIGDHVVLANGAALAGHITIEDHAIIGALSGVHQFCRVGTYAFISGLTGVSLDIPPYMLAAGTRPNSSDSIPWA